jgi:hypothetical protein
MRTYREVLFKPSFSFWRWDRTGERPRNEKLDVTVPLHWFGEESSFEDTPLPEIPMEVYDYSGNLQNYEPNWLRCYDAGYPVYQTEFDQVEEWGFCGVPQEVMSTMGNFLGMGSKMCLSMTCKAWYVCRGSVEPRRDQVYESRERHYGRQPAVS